MFNSKVKIIPRIEGLQQQTTLTKGLERTFSQDEIRTRAYQIYGPRNRNRNHVEDDLSPAETGLMMELLHAKYQIEGLSDLNRET